MTQATTHTPRRVFRDRREAGRVLARLLNAYRGKPDVVVLGLPRGGIPVAWEVAAALGAPLDAFVVRKLGAPGREEFAVGAMALGGRVVVNDDVVRGLRITPEQLREIAEREGRELIRREASYRGGRPPVGDRAAPAGVVFVLRTGIPWEYLPPEMGCGSGMTCWRRLRDWQRAGVWRGLHRVLLARLNAAGKIDWSRAVVDTTSVRAMHGGKKRGRAPWTAASRGRSTACSSTPRAGCRSPSGSTRPTGRTSGNCCRSWTTSRRYGARSAAPAAGSTSSRRTAGSTPTPTATGSGRGAATR